MPLAHLPPTTRPPGGCQNRGRCPHPRSPRGRGAGDAYGLTPAPQPQSVGSPPTSKGQAATRFFASLDRFPAPSASDRFATPKEMERVKGDAVVHFTLDALESTQHSAQGMWIGFATCPCGLASEWGLGQSPKQSFFGFWLGKLKIIQKKKVQFMSNFRMLTTKNTLNSAFLMPTPR